MFPLDDNGNYDASMLLKTEKLFQSYGFSKSLNDVLPPIVTTGQAAGYLTPSGAKLLDRDGDLMPCALLCPPEGDAITGMVAGNCTRPGLANISCGNSIFGSFILDHPMKDFYPEIDIVNLPNHHQVAMVHANNGTSAVDMMVNLVKDSFRLFHIERDDDEIYQALFQNALESDFDFSSLVLYNYLSGETIAQVEKGALTLSLGKDSKLSLSTLMLASLFSTFSTLSIGMNLLEKEKVHSQEIYAHGGIFRTRGVASKVLASILNQDVYISPGGNEGGAYGIALLAYIPATLPRCP